MATSKKASSVKSSSSPTWYSDIQGMFTAGDIACMKDQGYFLDSYKFVSTHASQIYQVTSSGYMPMGGPQWTADRVNTFLLWMKNGTPLGTPPLLAKLKGVQAVPVTRIRKDIRSLSQAEINTLKTAFQGIMNLPSTDPNSYYQLAGIHWLPEPNVWCMHHVPGFLTWHRAYQIVFENALRSIKGCENVTIPYWDITMQEPLPAWLFQAPFAAYTLPQSVGSNYPKGYVAGYPQNRNTAAQILKNLYGDPTQPGSNVFQDVANAMNQSSWEGFNGYFAGADYDTLIAAHDNAHNSIGNTISDQDVAAFDPLFWVFHNNWDRIFWEWQKKYNATTQEGITNTIANDTSSYMTFNDQTAAQVAPFTTLNPRYNSIDLLDLTAWGIDYAAPAATVRTKGLRESVRSIHAADAFSLDAGRVKIRVGNINRLKIPGSFNVQLLQDGKVISTRGFFQPNEVQKCATCVQNALAHFDFTLPVAQAKKGKFTAQVVPLKPQKAKTLALTTLGRPTIEVRVPIVRG